MESDIDVRKLPLVLVIDDEVDLLSEPLGSVGLEVAKLRERWKHKRIEYCERFGLVPYGSDTLEIASPVARAVFVAPIEWTGHSATLPSPRAPLAALEQALDGSAELVSLVLLDLQVEYGHIAESGTFDAVDEDFGLRVILPQILSTFGTDETGPGNTWTRYPVVVVSGLPKDRLDEDVRRAGARGMIAKQTNSSQARNQLRSYLVAHGLVPDTRGIICGRSLPLLNGLAAARRAADSRSSVLLLGESGTGKELLARYTHDHSPRASGPYGVYHAAGRGDELQEDELFGHWSGAFTGATRDQPGLLEELNKGTVFIDELGDIAPRVQNALMRPLQERQSSRIGRPRGQDKRPINLDLKFLFATNKDLDQAVSNGAFRPDLLQRISETTVKLPALRERREDIPLLAKTLLKQIDDDLEIGGSQACRHHFDQDALDYLQTLDYRDGNVRELRSLILQVALANPGEPRLTQTDFRQPTRAIRSLSASPPASVQAQPTHLPPALQIDALRRWITEGPEVIPHGELRQLVTSLRGSAPLFIVALLEVAVTGARLDGRPSLARVVAELWGDRPRTPQDARRALSRLLAVDWQGGTVADHAAHSPQIKELKIQELVKKALTEKGRHGT